MHPIRIAAGVAAGVATSALLVLPAAAASNNIIVTYAGNGQTGYSGDGGQATSAKLNTPDGVVLDNAANVFLSDSANNRVRKVTADGVISTVAGTGTAGYSGDGGQATAANLNMPAGLAADAVGNLYIADGANNRVRKVTAAGVITTVAGSGAAGYSGDGGPATAAKLRGPTGLAIDGAGNLYIADSGNHAVRKVLTNGTIVAFAGTGQKGFSGNTGPATKARLHSPSGLAVSGATVLIADSKNDQVRKVSGGTITAFAGTGSPGFSGDGGQATMAKLNKPVGLAFKPLGAVYILDTGNMRIREVTTSGTISTFAGTGVAGFSGDNGPAELAKLKLHPDNMSFLSTDAANVFFADTENQRVRRIHTSGPPPALPGAPGSQNLVLAGAALATLGGGVAIQRMRRRSLIAVAP